MKQKVYIDISVIGGCFDYAISTINQVNVLASWNFKYIVNLDRIRLYNAVNLKNGYTMLEIRNPREILKFSDDEE